MKTPPLPDIDLARFATSTPTVRENGLRRMRFSWAPYSYDPLRKCAPAILRTELPLLGPDEVPWDQIKKTLLSACRTEDAKAPNLAVATGLHDFAKQNNITGREHQFGRFKLSMGLSIAYWLPMILTVKKQPSVLFIDPRKSNALTREAMRFVFSVMHEHIRSANPDYADLNLYVLQFGPLVEGVRRPIFFKSTDFEPFSYEELQAMASETISLWQRIVVENEEKARRKGSR